MLSRLVVRSVLRWSKPIGKQIHSKQIMKTSPLFKFPTIATPNVSSRLSHHSAGCADHNHNHGPATVQKHAPFFQGDAVVDGEFKKISLQDYEGNWLVLVFYPLDFTFVCPTELVAFSDRIQEFKQMQTEVVGVSVDSKFSHLAWTKQSRKEGGLGKMNIPLLSDITKHISHDYGVLLEDGIALRGLFLIDPKGIVRHITMNDLPVGRSVDETLRVVKAFQYVEKHGEVCPADWNQGKPAMKGDPVGSQDYFKKHSKQ